MQAQGVRLQQEDRSRGLLLSAVQGLYPVPAPGVSGRGLQQRRQVELQVPEVQVSGRQTFSMALAILLWYPAGIG